MEGNFNTDISEITIIVVDDDEGLNNFITLKIQTLGFKCISALNLDVAKDMILNTKSCFVLLDYIMDNRFSNELVVELQEIGIKFPYIVLTGYGDTKLAIDFMKLGAYDFLIKSDSFLKELEPVLIKSVNRFLLEKRNAELQESLLKSERLYRLMAYNMCDIVCKHDMTGIFTYVSPSVTNILGYDQADLIGKHPANFIHPDDLKEYEDKVIPAIKKNIPWKLEYRFLKKNTEYIWVETYGTIIIDDAEATGEIQTVTRNINDRIVAELKLQHSEKQFRTAFEYAAVGMSLRALDGTILVINNAFCAMLGYEKNEMEGHKFSEFTHPDDVHLIASSIDKNPGTLIYKVNKRYIHKNGSIVWASVSSNVLTNENNIPLYFIAQIQNITEQRKAEELARMDDARLESLLRIYEFQTYEVSKLLDFALEEVIKLTNSKFGFIYNYIEESKQFELISWSKDVMNECKILEKPTVFEFENTGIWGEVVRQTRPIIVNDFPAPNHLKKGYPDCHVQLTKFLAIPVIYENKIVAVAGVANNKDDYDDKDIRQLTLMMDSLWEISIRKKTEFELSGRLEMEKLIAEISSVFVTNATENIDNAMFFVLSKIGNLTNADRAYIYIADESDTVVNNTHEWFREEGKSWKDKLQNLKISNFTWWAENFLNRKIINISNITEIPAHAEYEKMFMSKFDIKSQLFVPLIYANKVIGLIGVSALKEAKKWTQKDIDFLKTISSIIASALKNSEISTALMNSEVRYRKLVDRLPDMILMHHNGIITYVNEAAISILKYTANEFIGSDIFKYFEIDNPFLTNVIYGKYSGDELGFVEIKVSGKLENKVCVVRTEIVKLDDRLLTLVLLSDITKKKELENKIAKNIDKQSVLNSMLKLSLESISLDKLLDESFNMLMTIPWLTYEKRGCIFLVNEDGNLEMKSRSFISPEVYNFCRIIPFGKCLCGKAALRKEIIFVDEINEDHEVLYKGIIPHGYYCVPILFNEKILGVINIYLEEGHKENEEEKEFLTACANTIAGLIARKRSETELENTLGNLELMVQLRTQQINESKLVLLEEIEERKQIEEELSINKEKYKTIVEQSVYGIYIEDSTGKFIGVNSKGCEMSGYSKKEILNMKMIDFFTVEERASKPLRYDLLDKGKTVINERILTKKDKSTCYVEMSTRKMTDGTYQAVFRDITDKIKAEQKIKIALEKEQELNMLKSRFISLVSHEFRTPLAGLQLSVELLEKYSDKWDAKKKKDHFDKIYGGIRYTNLLLDDVSLMGKDDLGKLECNATQLNLTKLCYMALDDAKAVVNNIDIKILDDIAENMNNVILDETLVRHILTNLLTNALKYSPDGKNVKFRVKLKKSKVFITVSDEGIGIPEEDLKKIFERFHRAQNVYNIKGTGLGLSIVKKCVELMSGEIRIESKVGVGTTVYVELPEKISG